MYGTRWKGWDESEGKGRLGMMGEEEKVWLKESQVEVKGSKELGREKSENENSVL